MYFDDKGRLIPKEGDNTFSTKGNNFYKLNSKYNAQTGAAIIEKRSKGHEIAEEIKGDGQLQKILNGQCFYFKLSKNNITDIGEELENNYLNKLAQSIEERGDADGFKAITQDKKKISGRLKACEATGYTKFLQELATTDIEGLYFPMAMTGFSITSQRKRIKEIESNLNYCLSGPIEIAKVLQERSDMLIDQDHYSPVLCAGGVMHSDERLIACFKSYGKRIEFWVLSNILTRGIEQVSEQWSGGITIYKKSET